MKKPNSELPKQAKLCYGHISGKHEQLPTTAFIGKGWIAKNGPEEKNYYITTTGEQELTRLGINLSQIRS
jgi:hypothetical protein